MSVFRRDTADTDGPKIECACGCKKVLPQFDRKNRERRYYPGHQFAAWWSRGAAPKHPVKPR